MKGIVKLVVGAVVCLGSMSAHAVAYKVTNLGTAVVGAQGLDINDAGQVAGTLLTAPNFGQAAVWTAGSWQLLNPGVESRANGLNELGQVVGSTRVDGVDVATVWNSGAAQLLAGAAGQSSYALDINNAGQIVGGASGQGGPRATLWQNGGVQYLQGLAGVANDINESGQIAGWIQTGFDPFFHAVVWDNGTPIQYGEDFTHSYAQGLNNFGVAVGNGPYYDGMGGDSQSGARAWGGDPYFVPGAYNEFVDINDSGVAIGSGFRDTFGDGHAMVYVDGVAYDLNNLLVGDLAGLGELIGAAAINSSGQIVAYGVLDGGFSGQPTHAFLLTPVAAVPEPEHWAMLLIGLGLVGAAARRRA